MTMRKREEIEEETMLFIQNGSPEREGLAVLEVLLDIRELLTPVQFEVRKPSDEEIQKVIEHWKKAHDDRP